MRNRTLQSDTAAGMLRAVMHGKEVDLWTVCDMINDSRKLAGNPEIKVTPTTLLRSRFLRDVTVATEKRVRVAAPPDSERNLTGVFRSPLIRTTRGYGGGIWVHPFIAVSMLVRHAPLVSAEVVEALFSGGVFSRGDGNDIFNVMADMVSGIFRADGINPLVGLAKLSSIIAARCGVEIRVDNTTWDYASLAQHQARIEIINAIINLVHVNTESGIPTSSEFLIGIAHVAHISGSERIGNHVTIAEVIANDVASLASAFGVNASHPPLMDDGTIECDISFEVDIDPATGQWYSWDTYLPDGSLNLAREGAEFV